MGPIIDTQHAVLLRSSQKGFDQTRYIALDSPNNREATLLHEEYPETIAFVVFGCRDEKEFTRLHALQSCSRCDWIIVSVFPPRFCG
jgi:hypothetical protein